MDNSFPTEDIALCNKYDHPYSKDRTNHGCGNWAYVSTNLTHKRRNDLEIYWEENIWLETYINKQIYLTGIFYSPKTSDPVLFNSFNLNIEKAMEIARNIIIVGDLNEDLLNVYFHNLQDILKINSLQNVIAEPTRGRALLDPTIFADDCVDYNTGAICNPSDISDHICSFLMIIPCLVLLKGPYVFIKERILLNSVIRFLHLIGIV